MVRQGQEAGRGQGRGRTRREVRPNEMGVYFVTER